MANVPSIKIDPEICSLRMSGKEMTDQNSNAARVAPAALCDSTRRNP